MDTKAILSKTWSVLAAILLFFLISLVYFNPVLEGKKLQSSDGIHFKGMSKEIVDYREATGEEALWSNNMFSGMPAYLTSVKYPGEVLTQIQKAFMKIPRPVITLTLSFAFFFILCLILNIQLWVAFAASLAYGFMTFNFVVMVTGHLTKAHTLVYMSLVVAGILLAFKKNRIAGSIIAAIGLAWMLSANHLQMTYYAAILILILGITYLVFAIIEKQLASFMKTASLLIVAAVIAVGANFSRLYTTYEYGQYSIRSKSELTSQDENKTSGLDKSYILEYSYDLGEAMTAFIPRFKGGGMGEPLGENSNFFKILEQSQGKKRAGDIAKRAPLYWGSQPISVAPFYFGAVLCFLFVFGLFVVKGKDKWWLLAVFIVSFLLTLGKNFSLLTDLMIDYFPGYNKFRDVKNLIVIQQFAMALIGVFAIRDISQGKLEKAEVLKALKYSFIVVGGGAFLFVLLPGLAGNFTGKTDAQYLQMGWPQELINALIADRKTVLRADAFRTFVFVALAAATLWAYVSGKLKAKYALPIWIALIVFDMWPVNKKYFNNDNFTSQRKVSVPYQKDVVDNAILQDDDLYYRVLNLRNPFADSRTCYFHKSLGGYHGAKMRRYNEVATQKIVSEMQLLVSAFQTPEKIDSVLQSLSVINMLNTKYFIYNEKNPPIANSAALGNAWFVESVKMVEGADEEFAALSDFDSRAEVIVDKRFEELISSSNFDVSGSRIELKEYKPNYLKYQASLDGEQLAVFSEIYYPKGWKAFIDGQEVEHFWVNYLLRAMTIPSGEHTIEFKFEPQSYFLGNKVSLASSLFLLLAALAVGFIEIRKSIKKNEEETGEA